MVYDPKFVREVLELKVEAGNQLDLANALAKKYDSKKEYMEVYQQRSNYRNASSLADILDEAVGKHQHSMAVVDNLEEIISTNQQHDKSIIKK